ECKKEIVDYARNHRNNQAAKHFDIDHGMTSEIKEKSKRVGSGRKALFPEAEKKLYTWIIQQRKEGLAVTYVTIRNKMLEILKESEMVVLYGNIGEDFKTSQHWILGFMKRFNLALRRQTRISQKLPNKTQEQLEKFQKFVKKLRIEKPFELGNIFNMDETPVWFDMAGVYTINPKGEKTVHIRAMGNEKNRFTVVLTCATDGSKFLPSASSKENECREKYVDYFNDIWVKSGLRENSAMLVYDSFRGHLEDSIKERFHESDVHLAVIPGGLTSKCQPLDISINKPFKDNLRKEWHSWMASGDAGETAAENLRRASLSDVCLWVKRSWE
ncbi:5819_t:CDS:2, partial [Acaulospora morrowiae]